ncbi:hypothetical protein R3P38DRAFT_3168260 [Favolaschia claudopus]|uniref:Uncharacterized protein n=1 Tax=Favolaschia claudopus TaxID=2862362 RepID=A0AAW0E6A5_9AGAR
MSSPSPALPSRPVLTEVVNSDTNYLIIDGESSFELSFEFENMVPQAESSRPGSPSGRSNPKSFEGAHSLPPWPSDPPNPLLHDSDSKSFEGEGAAQTYSLPPWPSDRTDSLLHESDFKSFEGAAQTNSVLPWSSESSDWLLNESSDSDSEHTSKDVDDDDDAPLNDNYTHFWKTLEDGGAWDDSDSDMVLDDSGSGMVLDDSDNASGNGTQDMELDDNLSIDLGEIVITIEERDADPAADLQLAMPVPVPVGSVYFADPQNVPMQYPQLQWDEISASFGYPDTDLCPRSSVIPLWTAEAPTDPINGLFVPEEGGLGGKVSTEKGGWPKGGVDSFDFTFTTYDDE